MSELEDRQAPRQRSVDVYDFRRPTTLPRQHSRVLEVAFETFARQWGTQLTAKVRVKSSATLEQLSMQSYDEYAASLPSVTSMVLCRIDGSESRLVLQFPATAALAWISRMLGGSGDADVPERKFTQIEHALVRRMVEDSLEDLKYSLGSLLAAPLAMDVVQYNSQFAQAAAPGELMIVATFSVQVGELPSAATLAIPADVLLPGLGAVNPTAPTADAGALVRAQVAQVPVDVAVQLARTSVTPAQILGLAVGDVLPLPHPENSPFDVTVNGTRLATAAPARNGSRAAAVIVTTEENPR
ncbi:surface presentation of antigens (SPOA) protein [Pseudarthrobacter chlorophenolicus A6]|uniref:Flagellar motor switch protein FliM n=1 Tax=Pseudarthrobacter chlorophenolicus (strain ATCC 700700 / DSM 12829 / CIP 107037 / JCM 12360 / KCTC 9906 / NCIMB 13794 / A6) TaxID=452863 RepID=B8HEJ5_PSECP|nr:flagellar motor switch protein FliM [Pseudarthrobacter chlorophenolicus]ACL40940.1 surface presentation of antigens (SPOA) protein [Pseudarthrobacter chlorophenolicus A6]SDQ72519.1 flagellar motor switch protein FliM [Pseudarthrobacter chlorophenolicus]